MIKKFLEWDYSVLQAIVELINRNKPLTMGTIAEHINE
jgi:hypothetical protein